MAVPHEFSAWKRSASMDTQLHGGTHAIEVRTRRCCRLLIPRQYMRQRLADLHLIPQYRLGNSVPGVCMQQSHQAHKAISVY